TQNNTTEMVEPVGTTIGALGLLGLVTVALDCFDRVQDGMSLGKDFILLKTNSVIIAFVSLPGPRRVASLMSLGTIVDWTTRLGSTMYRDNLAACVCCSWTQRR